MVTVFDVDANKLIANAAAKLKSEVKKPAFVGIVKTGPHAERPPSQQDFWYIRCASILRQAYVQGNVGTNRLRRHYGGRKKQGVRPEKHVPAGGSTIRKAMQELEKAGLLTKTKQGRQISAKGRKFLDHCAKESGI
ncbi:30S ribosomal protein S19e [Candidatus Micrarchaeota archaeon]|nr:30S ribosomal protein S19e [Candidatus Micrarchaeota archaeon]